MEDINKCKELIGKIYVLYIKSKIGLAQAHITRSPKLYFEKFNIQNDPKINIEILDYLITRESPIYAELSKKSWVLFVLEITKILSTSKGEKFGIGKLYNKLLNKEFKEDRILRFELCQSFRPDGASYYGSNDATLVV